jgi:primosomal protein N' (replication factor Y)
LRNLPPPRPPRPPASGPVDDLARLALQAPGKRAVLRLPPAADAYGLALAAAGCGDALVLTPSVDAAASLAGRLRRAGHDVALAPRDWARAAAGGCTVVGARAAAWAPVPDLAAVVVLDAHDEGYASEAAPTWNAWIVAAERARRAGVPCVLASPCPPLEADGFGELVAPSRSDERAGWTQLDIVDRTDADPRTGMFSERLVTLLRGEPRVVCVLNRKGRARLLACAACGTLARCERCEAAVEQAGEALHCRRCGYERPVVCRSCGAQRLKILRAGVSRVREELEALAGVPVGEVTGDTGELPDTSVLVGTEAVLHRVPTPVRAVAFLDIDQELLAPRYRAGEQALALLARAARLTGGRSGGGRVLVQTRLPRHEVLQSALHGDPERLTAVERPRRALLNFPPSAALAVVSGEAAAEYVDRLGATPVEMLGPDDGQWLVRGPDHKTLCDALASVERPAGRLRVEVDPLRL